MEAAEVYGVGCTLVLDICCCSGSLDFRFSTSFSTSQCFPFMILTAVHPALYPMPAGAEQRAENIHTYTSWLPFCSFIYFAFAYLHFFICIWTSYCNCCYFSTNLWWLHQWHLIVLIPGSLCCSFTVHIRHFTLFVLLAHLKKMQSFHSLGGAIDQCLSKSLEALHPWNQVSTPPCLLCLNAPQEANEDTAAGDDKMTSGGMINFISVGNYCARLICIC